MSTVLTPPSVLAWHPTASLTRHERPHTETDTHSDRHCGFTLLLPLSFTLVTATLVKLGLRARRCHLRCGERCVRTDRTSADRQLLAPRHCHTWGVFASLSDFVLVKHEMTILLISLSKCFTVYVYFFLLYLFLSWRPNTAFSAKSLYSIKNNLQGYLTEYV